MALRDRKHKLPVKAEVQEAFGKKAGDTMRVVLAERIDGETEFDLGL